MARLSLPATKTATTTTLQCQRPPETAIGRHRRLWRLPTRPAPQHGFHAHNHDHGNRADSGQQQHVNTVSQATIQRVDSDDVNDEQRQKAAWTATHLPLEALEDVLLGRYLVAHPCSISRWRLPPSPWPEEHCKQQQQQQQHGHDQGATRACRPATTAATTRRGRKSRE